MRLIDMKSAAHRSLELKRSKNYRILSILILLNENKRKLSQCHLFWSACYVTVLGLYRLTVLLSIISTVTVIVNVQSWWNGLNRTVRSACEILTMFPGMLFSTVCQVSSPITCSATSNDSTGHPPLCHVSIASVTNVEFTSVRIALCAGTIGAVQTKNLLTASDI